MGNSEIPNTAQDAGSTEHEEDSELEIMKPNCSYCMS